MTLWSNDFCFQISPTLVDTERPALFADILQKHSINSLLDQQHNLITGQQQDNTNGNKNFYLLLIKIKKSV